MRTALTIGTRHGGKVQSVIAGENVSLPAQRDAFKVLSVLPTHPDFERIDLWEKDGGKVRSKGFNKPDKKKSD